MAHVRQTIREQIASTLISNVSLVASRVFTTRVYPLTQPQLPAITVYAGSESSNLMTMGLKTLNRVVNVNVDIYENATADLDDNIDAISVQVEESLANNFTLGGNAKDIVLISTDIDYSGDTEQPVGIARLTFAVNYITAINDVETAR
jgi:hypothetical protein